MFEFVIWCIGIYFILIIGGIALQLIFALFGWVLIGLVWLFGGCK